MNLLVTLRQILRWAAAGTIAAALATWLVAMAFALAGFRRSAEAVTEALPVVVVVALTLLGLLAVVFLLIVWLARRSKSRLPS